MQFSENWLRTFVNPDLSSDALGHAMTMAGLEVEEKQPAGVAFSHVVIAEILEAEKHPDADRLQVCKVNVGNQVLQIVCGAPNARAGMKAPCALVGAELPGISIKQAKVRGMESFGMMCSAKELGLAAEANGLLELPNDAQVGQDIREYFNLNDTLFTLKLTPNRADCLSVFGIARDVAAMTGATLIASAADRVDIGSQRAHQVQVEAEDACPAYYGRIIEGVNAQAATPDWMKQRLERSGVRSISAIVDVTNYVLLELGQPMHAFDLNKLSGKICVRFAKEGESLKLLNDIEVKLKADDLVIADAQSVVALAGIMGGEPTSVTNDTTDIFLESAFFTPDVMAGKARRLGLSTDSSYRFERGVDFGNTENALERASALIMQICGGKAGPVTQVVGSLPNRSIVTLRYQRLCDVLGMHVPQADVSKLLVQLGFQTQEKDGVYSVQAPSYRFDIAREEDLIEEVARLQGYEHLPALSPQANLNMLPASEKKRSTSRLRDILVSHGYQEAITYSFVDAGWERDLMGNENPIALKNPIASNMGVMRSGLWGGLLSALTYNLNRKQDRVRLFELGTSYGEVPEGYAEKAKTAAVLYGDVLPEQWAEKARQVDFFDAKATVDALCGNMVEYRAESHPALHPGQSAAVYLRGKHIGWLGKLHPKWQQQYDLAKNTFLFELDTEALMLAKVAQYREVPKFPAVRRDVAVIVDENIPVQAIVQAVQKAKIPLLQELQLFDVYQGKGIEENKKSLAFLVLMQDTDRTLQDADTDAVMEKLLKLLQTQFDAQLRS